MTDGNGNEARLDEVKLISSLQERIARKLSDLRYTDDESAGDIIHHLAEVAVLGNNLFKDSIPKFLALPIERTSDLAEIIFSIKWDLEEMKEAIADMDPHLLKLGNFLDP